MDSEDHEEKKNIHAPFRKFYYRGYEVSDRFAESIMRCAQMGICRMSLERVLIGVCDCGSFV
jgi:hypothetical protein